jgi:hypothetical protein
MILLSYGIVPKIPSFSRRTEAESIEDAVEVRFGSCSGRSKAEATAMDLGLPQRATG